MNKFFLVSVFLLVPIVIAEEVSDPFEDLNRVSFEFNEKLDEKLLKPIAKTYSKFPPKIKLGVTNFFNNLEDVETSLNQFLQGKPKKSLNDITRFIINSTIGLAGFVDVASKIGLDRHEEDFGQTLGVWGVGSGPFLMIPLYGPSTPRGLAGRSVSSVLSGTFAIEETDVRIGITALDALETRARYLEVETLIIGDRYSFIRDSYMQYQEFESSDGENQTDDFIEDMDDFLLD